MKASLFAMMAVMMAPGAFAQLPGSTRGEEAIRKHASQMGAIASRHGLSQNKLERLLRKDDSLVLNTSGRLYVSDENLLPNFLDDQDEEVLNPGVDQIPDSMALRLHSKPGAKKTVLLDFTGHYVVGTSWNYSGPIDALPFDMDGNPTTAFSLDERKRIIDIWLRVAEDFAAFDVNVTTEDVASEDILNKSSTSDDIYGVRVLLTPSNEWYGNGAGGVAYVNSITWGDSTPCWVFADLLGNNAKYLAEASSHEAGHTMGLRHQAAYDANGVMTATYNGGAGTGDYGWAPIMGVGYYKKNTLWHDGPDSYGPNNFQNDLNFVTTHFPYAADDAPNTVSNNSFTKVRFISANNVQEFKHQGTISAKGEVDVLRVYAGSGPLNINVSGAVQSTNLDFKVRLRSPSGVLLSENDPAGSANVAISLADVAEGIYHLEVLPMGYTDANNVLIYSNYGVNGKYYVTGSSQPYSLSIPADTFPTGSTPSNQAPSANAGADKIVVLPANSVAINGTGFDLDGTLDLISWSQVSGPSSAALSGQNTFGLNASSLVAGTYVFRLTLRDNAGASSSDDVSVVVKTNSAPTVNAGRDVSITLPVSSVVLRATAADADGSIAERIWTQVSGPSAAVITNGTTLSPTVSSLVMGTYTFKITVKDNAGAIASDNVAVKVNKCRKNCN